ncbi:MAG TPA: response regulator [Methylomirabilota bacterium]|nr:response regulator [Methylomirabilota bacterium]
MTADNPATAPAVLVVDDEADLLGTYERILHRIGYAVITAGTRAAGLAALEAASVGLVVADVRLPDGDGLDLVRAARDSRLSVPAIVVTGYASKAGRRDALAAGAAAYLAKPFSISQLIATVESVLGRGNHRQ